MKNRSVKWTWQKRIVWSAALYTGLSVLMLLLAALLIKKEIISQYETHAAAAAVQIAAAILSGLILNGAWVNERGKWALLHGASCAVWSFIWNVILYRHIEISSLWVVPTMIISCFFISLLKKSSKLTKVSYGKMKGFRHI